MLGYLVSALWRQSHPWAVRAWLGLSILMGLTAAWQLGILSLWLGLCCALWEPFAQWRADRCGHRVWFVLPSPAKWCQRQLRQLGYSGPVASSLWEIHVQERQIWLGESPHDAARHFRTAFTADFFRWVEERSDHRALVLSTFNHLTSAEVTQLRAVRAWIGSGAIHPRLPQLADVHRMESTQRRMFGGVVSHRDRTNPATWTTVYIPPRTMAGV